MLNLFPQWNINIVSLTGYNQHRKRKLEPDSDGSGYESAGAARKTRPRMFVPPTNKNQSSSASIGVNHYGERMMQVLRERDSAEKAIRAQKSNPHATSKTSSSAAKTTSATKTTTSATVAKKPSTKFMTKEQKQIQTGLVRSETHHHGLMCVIYCNNSCAAC